MRKAGAGDADQESGSARGDHREVEDKYAKDGTESFWKPLLPVQGFGDPRSPCKTYNPLHTSYLVTVCPLCVHVCYVYVPCVCVCVRARVRGFSAALFFKWLG